MSDPSATQQAIELEGKIALLTNNLVQAKAVVQQWVETNTSLSRSAAEVRAKNQGAGRGFFGAILGSKFRSAVRTGAAASNAAIAQDVADKRSRITEGKREAQEVVRRIQGELAETKQILKAVTSTAKQRASKDAKKSSSDSIDLLHRLKEAREAGLLTEEEFEEKRKKLVSSL